MASDSHDQPTVSVIGAGAMGSAVAKRMHALGAGAILTNLEGRSASTHERARDAGMQPVSYADIVDRAAYILSIVPASQAGAVAQQVLDAYTSKGLTRRLVFADLNPLNPENKKAMGRTFEGTGVVFVDGTIFGLPPSETNDPGVYVVAEKEDEEVFDEFVDALRRFGLVLYSMKGEGVGVGNASSLKNAHSMITKGSFGMMIAAILAANASSPTTARHLAQALEIVSPSLIDLAAHLLGQFVPKTYRNVREMEEVSAFIGDPDGRSRIYDELARLFAGVKTSHDAYKEDPASSEAADAAAILEFAEEAERISKSRNSK